MRIRKHIKKIMAVGCIALLGMTLAGCADMRLSTQEYNQAIEDAKAGVDITADNAAVIANAVAAVDITSDNDKVVSDAIAALTAEQVPGATQQQIIVDATEAEAEVDAETDAKGYNVDELTIGAEFNQTLSDREIGIFDDEIDFDGDEYDAEEIIYLTDLKIAANEEEDWNTDTLLQLPEGGIKYMLEFAANLNTSLIGDEEENNEDETLVFDLLGEEVEVSKWNDDEVTFTKGDEVDFNEGQQRTIGDMVVKVTTIHATDDTGYVKVYVNDVGKKIYEGTTKKVNGLDVKVVEVLVDDDVVDSCLLETGEDVEVTIENGDEYEKDSIWEWSVDANSIGLTLVEELTSIDEDEDFKAIAVDDKICLPNDYVCVIYDGLTAEDTEDYDFELKTKSGTDYVMVKGEFIDGIEDYNKIYIDVSGDIFDDDLELIGDSIELADTDLTLETDGTSITIESGVVLVETNFALDMLEADGIDISGEDEDYITNYGIVIKNPDDNIEDNELELTIPEEELEASITVISK